MSKVNRGEKILNRLVSEQKLTPCGRDWLVAALDPFHDNQLQSLEGWPDVECGASVVRCVKKTMAVSVPTALAANPWNCHIIQMPFLNRHSDENGPAHYIAARTQSFVQGPLLDTTSQALGGLMIYATPVDSPSLDLITSELVGSLDLDASFTQGSGRLIGVGFEVHNTTAEIYKQGSCLVYRMQADNRDPCVFNMAGSDDATNLYSGSFSGQMLRYPPQTPEFALLLQGSRQWEAREGCYVVSAFHSQENPAFPITTSVPIFQGGQIDDLENTINTTQMLAPYPVKTTIAGQTSKSLTVIPQRVHPIHQSGAIFMGLSPQSTLTVNVNYFYESFPGPNEEAILVMAKPSCKYDPVAMELYSRVIQELPVGVPVAENGLGDWFLDAATKAAKWLGPALMAIPHPIAKGAGALATYLSDTGTDFVKKNNTSFQAPPNAWEQEGGGSMFNNAEIQLFNAKKKEKKLKKKIRKQKAKQQRPQNNGRRPVR